MEKRDTKHVDLETTLKAVGKEAFVKFYYDFKSRKLGQSQLAEKIYKENPRSKSTNQNLRIGRAFYIFDNKLEIEALQIIIGSSKVSDAVKLRAKELLLKESTGKSDENLLDNISKELKNIGKAAFVNFYYDFKSNKLNRAQLSTKLHQENPNSTSIRQDRRIDSARAIFESGSEKEALKIVINSSSRVSDEIKLKAKELLSNESNQFIKNNPPPKIELTTKQEISQFSEKDIEDIINYEDNTAALRSISVTTKQRIVNYEIITKLKELYEHRCQICGNKYFDMVDVNFVEAHHIEPFIDSQNNNASNIIILCPNHHRLMHKAKPTFDREEKVFIYANGYREKLMTNYHL